jgi:hypothetical protein
MFGKPDEEKQAQRQAEELAEQRRAAAVAKERAEREYAASPVGRAEAALARGDRFFQIQLPVSSLTGDRSWFGSSENAAVEHAANGARTDGKPDVLTQIEDAGWHLEHAGYVFVETGATSSARMFSTGEGTVTEGSVQGIYLFRAAGVASRAT